MPCRSGYPGPISSSFLQSMLAPINHNIECAPRIPSRQFWHSRCVRLVSPQPGHLHRWLTSLRAFPAICLCLFRECDTLFLGTARSTDSQISSIVGRLRLKPGMAMESVGSSGCVNCRVYRVAHREMGRAATEESRGKREAVMAAIVMRFRALWLTAPRRFDEDNT